MYACVCGDQGAAFSDEAVLNHPKGKANYHVYTIILFTQSLFLKNFISGKFLATLNRESIIVFDKMKNN